MTIEARVGAFVIASLLVLGVTVYSVRATHDVRGQVTYRTYFSYAGGVADGTPVLFAGIRVGEVVAVRPSPDDPTRIEIAFTVKTGTPVNAESIARVGSVTLMSSPALFLTSGRNSARRLAAGEVVQSKDAVSQDEIAARIGTLAVSANDLLVALKQEVPPTVREARAALTNLRQVTGQTNQKHVAGVLAELDGMLQRESPKIAEITSQLTALTGHADEVAVSAKPLVANADRTISSVNATVDALREPLIKDLAELQHTLEEAGAVMVTVHGLLGDNAGDIDEMVRSLRAASDNVRVLSETLKERPWSLIRTSQPADRKVPR